MTIKKPKSKKSKIEASIRIPETNWFKEILDVATEKGQILWNEPVKYHRASAVGDPCIRSLALNMLGYNSIKEARTLRIFRTGNLIEQTNIENMKRAGILKSEQGEIKYDYFNTEEMEELVGLPFIVGHYDAVVEKDDKEWLVEIKSINEKAFDKLPPEHGLKLAGDSPILNQFPKYIHQINTYLGSDVDVLNGFLLFEAKNTQRQKIYFIKHDPELLAKNLYKLQEAWDYGINEEIPPIPDGFNPKDKKDKGCGWCDKRAICPELSEGVVKLADIKKKDAELRGN